VQYNCLATIILNDKKKLILLFVLALLPLISSVSLNPNTILNTTISNSSVTFSFNVNITNITINNNAIYMVNVNYTKDDVWEFCDFINYSVENSNLDSANFPCGTEDVEVSGVSGEGAVLRRIDKFKDKIKKNFLFIILLIIVGFYYYNQKDNQKRKDLNSKKPLIKNG